MILRRILLAGGVCLRHTCMPYIDLMNSNMSLNTNPIHEKDNLTLNILFDKHLDLAGITICLLSLAQLSSSLFVLFNTYPLGQAPGCKWIGDYFFLKVNL